MDIYRCCLLRVAVRQRDSSGFSTYFRWSCKWQFLTGVQTLTRTSSCQRRPSWPSPGWLVKPFDLFVCVALKKMNGPLEFFFSFSFSNRFSMTSSHNPLCSSPPKQSGFSPRPEWRLLLFQSKNFFEFLETGKVKGSVKGSGSFPILSFSSLPSQTTTTK